VKWAGQAAVVVSVINVWKHGQLANKLAGESNSPSQSQIPLKRNEENEAQNPSRFQPTSAIRPEIDFRAGVDGDETINSTPNINANAIDFSIAGESNSPSQSQIPLKRNQENEAQNSSRFQPTSAIRPEIDFRALKPTLDGKEVPLISAFLFHAGGNENPTVLLANAEKSFIGSYVLGMGFTFDDSNPEATPIAEMHRLIEKDAKNPERIFPYIGGEEVNSSPTHAHRRYVINFGEMSEDEARQYPDLMAIVEEKVKPARLKQNREIRARYWWRFGETTPALFRAIALCDRVLVCCIIGKHLSFAFLPNKMVYSHKLNIFALTTYSAFAILQGRMHEVFARFFSSTLEDRLNYSPTDCFETFPFPENWETNPTLESVGKEYYEYRAELMVRNNQGLTDTYNRFHHPEERDPDILKLRTLHTAMDKAVLEAYGWGDISTDCTFLLDYEDADEEETNKRKKPWRYRWTEEVHDEVLARLLELNKERANMEEIGGKKAENKSKAKGTKKKTTKPRKIKADEPIIPGLDGL
jgi:hypothetical protein